MEVVLDTGASLLVVVFNKGLLVVFTFTGFGLAFTLLTFVVFSVEETGAAEVEYLLLNEVSLTLAGTVGIIVRLSLSACLVMGEVVLVLDTTAVLFFFLLKIISSIFLLLLFLFRSCTIPSTT